MADTTTEPTEPEADEKDVKLEEVPTNDNEKERISTSL